MIASAAKPLRALAGLMMIYGVSRLAIASYDFLPTHQAAITLSVAETVTSNRVWRRAGPASIRAAHVGSGEASAIVEAAPVSVGQANAKLGRVPYRSTPSIDEAPVRHASIASRPAPAQTVAGADNPEPAPVAHDLPRLSSASAQAGAAPPGAPAPGRSSRGAGGLSGSAWALVRSGTSTRDLAGTGSLGGSQVGARLILPIAASPAFVTARVSSAMSQRDREVALGIGLRGRAAGLIVEQRFAVDGRRRNETAIVGYGGFSEVALPGKFKLDGYGQVGIVGVKRQAAFVDGALRAERAIAQSDGGVRLSAGAGIWGGAQPGASRLDVGPQIVARIPAGKVSARLALEYRAKIAGDARPPNGVAVTLGADF